MVLTERMVRSSLGGLVLLIIAHLAALWMFSLLLDVQCPAACLMDCGQIAEGSRLKTSTMFHRLCSVRH